jgi:hypothetical protein
VVAGVTVGVRVLQDVEQVAALDWKTTSSNPMPRSVLSFAFFASSQSKYFTDIRVAQSVPNRHTLASGFSAPEPGPRTLPTLTATPTIVPAVKVPGDVYS